jgi:AcrR family transcriptional regulator
MDEIANHLGMSKKTIYQYYADKDALVAEVIRMEVEHNKDCCCQHKEKSDNAIHEVFLVIDMLQDLLNNMNPVVMFDLEKYHPKAFTIISEYKQKFLYDVMKENMEWGIKDELYRPEVNIEIMVRFRLASTFLMFNTDIFPLAKFSPLQVATEITEGFLYGLATTKGHKLIQKYKQQRIKKQHYE